MSERLDVFSQIRKEHQEIAAMLQELSRGYDKQLFKSLRLALTAHMTAEEASLYPAMAGLEHEGVKRAEEGHKEIRNALSRFGLGTPVDFPSKLSELAAVVTLHVKDEEENTLPMAQAAFDRQKVDELSYLFYETERRIKERAL